MKSNDDISMNFSLKSNEVISSVKELLILHFKTITLYLMHNIAIYRKQHIKCSIYNYLSSRVHVNSQSFNDLNIIEVAFMSRLT